MIKHTSQTMTLGEFIDSYKLSKNQGELSDCRVRELAVDIIAALQNPTNPPVVYKDEVIVGNHRYEAAKRLREQHLIDSALTLTVTILDPKTPREQVAEWQYRDNFDHATDRKREQYALNPAFDLSSKVFIPLNKVLEQHKDITRTNRLELVVKLGARLNHFGELPTSGAELYEAKQLPEADALEGMKMKASSDLNKDVAIFGAVKNASIVFGEFYKRAKDVAKSRGEKLSDYLGQTRTSFPYVIFAAALTGKLTSSNCKTAAARLPAKRSKIKRALGTFTTGASGSEAAILEALGISSE